MRFDDLTGRAYGPYPYRTCQEKVAEYLAATGDDPARWDDQAPPALAGALLFVVAPHLLGDPQLGGVAVIHGDQAFTWHAPLPVEEALAVSGTVERVRTRGGVAYVEFSLLVEGSSGPLVEGTSLFLMSGAAPPPGGASEEPEPPPDAAPRRPGIRSASRSDLVRYAAASRDWNPIHWDHGAAVEAGLSGVVVHGLLQSAWALQEVPVAPGARITGARFRYRAPLRPSVAVEATAEPADSGHTVRLSTPDGILHLSAAVEVG